jgi:phage FluMu protein Com
MGNMGIQPDLVSMTCNNCGKKLAEVKVKDGIVSIKCSKCGTLNIVSTPTTLSSSGR